MPVPRRWRSRVEEWAPVFLAYFSSQTLVQLLGIAAGLILVNTMPVREFALYTLAMSAFTFFTFFTDLGSTSSLVHFFRQTAREGEEFQPYVAAVLSLRRLAFLAGAAVVLIVFPRLASGKQFDAFDIGFTTAGILIAVWFQIGASLQLLNLRLSDLYGLSYRAEIAGGVLRLLLVAGMVASSLLFSWIAVLAGAVASLVVVLVARSLLPAAAGALRGVAACRRRVLRYLLPTLPSALYFSVQGPLVVWLAASFGSTETIAEVGALGRLGLIVGMFSGLAGVVFLPRLSRITDDDLYRRRYFQFGALLLATAVVLVGAAMAAPDMFLWLLGSHYRGLHSELVLMVASSGLSLLGGYAVAVNMARSWIRWQTLAVIGLAAVQALLVWLLPLGTTAGVLRFTLGSAIAGLALQLITNAAGFLRPRWVLWHS